jgi:hypothetical protein
MAASWLESIEAWRRAHLEVEKSRFDSNGIRRLYDAAAYPLARRDAGSSL